MPRILLIVLSFALVGFAGGCSGRPVGEVSITDHGSAIAEPVLTGEFDSVLTRKDGRVYTIVAYQQIAGRRPFYRYYRNYRKDFPFITAELTLRLVGDGVDGQPVLRLRQGEHILTTGPLQGELTLTPQDNNQLLIRGEAMTWLIDGATDAAPGVSFELEIFNPLVPSESVARGRGPGS